MQTAQPRMGLWYRQAVLMGQSINETSNKGRDRHDGLITGQWFAAASGKIMIRFTVILWLTNRHCKERKYPCAPNWYTQERWTTLYTRIGKRYELTKHNVYRKVNKTFAREAQSLPFLASSDNNSVLWQILHTWHSWYAAWDTAAISSTYTWRSICGPAVILDLKLIFATLMKFVSFLPSRQI